VAKKKAVGIWNLPTAQKNFIISSRPVYGQTPPLFLHHHHQVEICSRLINFPFPSLLFFYYNLLMGVKVFLAGWKGLIPKVFRIYADIRI